MTTTKAGLEEECAKLTAVRDYEISPGRVFADEMVAVWCLLVGPYCSLFAGWRLMWSLLLAAHWCACVAVQVIEGNKSLADDGFAKVDGELTQMGKPPT